MTTAGISGYRSYLVQRNGDADLLNRRLERREEFFARIDANPVRSIRTLDVDLYERGLRARRPAKDMSREIAFLLATAKLNQAERFGVGLGELYGLNSTRDLPEERVYLELEEHYHTRMLAYVLDIFGISFRVLPPPYLMRQFVKIGVFVPDGPSFPFVGAGEMAGCVMFDLLGRAGVDLFSGEPEVAERIRTLYGEILTDEIGHVGYCAARTSRAGRALMRRLYPLFAGFFTRQVPEILAVIDRDTLSRRLNEPFDFGVIADQLPSNPFIAAVP